MFRTTSIARSRLAVSIWVMTLSHTEEEGLEIMEALYKWLKVGRKQLNQLQDFLT